MLAEKQKKEIDDLRKNGYQTFRSTVPALEEILFLPTFVLNHGFVRVVDYMGDDAAIVQAARVSYGSGTKKVNQDRGLINYLMRHRHTTPFEMCEIKFHIKLPIFIARQWIRHRTANVNEYSARYSILDKEFYIPDRDKLAPQSSENHQGRSNQPLEGEEAAKVLELLKNDAEQCYSSYQNMTNEDTEGNVINANNKGLARELARMNLNLNYYTQWYWKIDLHNLMHFLSLRADSHAQHEIQAYAYVMLDMMKKWVPFTYDAFMEYKKGGAHLSKSGLAVVKRIMNGETVTEENSGMNRREWGELMGLLRDKDDEK